jgi:hypothetical protein
MKNSRRSGVCKESLDRDDLALACDLQARLGCCCRAYNPAWPQPQAATMPALWPGCLASQGSVPPEGGAPFVLGGANQASQPPLNMMTSRIRSLGAGPARTNLAGWVDQNSPAFLVAKSTILTLPSYLAGMIRLHTATEAIALRMLARNGVAAIWQLQVAAGIAYRTGHPGPAASIMEIAEAAEREVLRRGEPSVQIGDWQR